MKVLALYESITGNTAFAVEAVRLVVEGLGHECTVARYSKTSPRDLAGQDLYCFATPVMSFAPLAPVWRFLGRTADAGGAPAFFVTTCGGWPGAAHSLLGYRLRTRGFRVLGDHYMTCADSWPVSRTAFRRLYGRLDLPGRASLLKLADFTGEMCGRAERLHVGAHVELPRYRPRPTLTLPLALNALGGGLRRSFGRRTVDAASCNRCGLCVKACPVSAVTLEDVPVFSRYCIGCWGCFNACPESAIRSSLAAASSRYAGIADVKGRLREAGLLP